MLKDEYFVSNYLLEVIIETIHERICECVENPNQINNSKIEAYEDCIKLVRGVLKNEKERVCKND